MKALYIYSDKTGLKRSEKKDKKIILELFKIFKNLDVKKSNDLKEFETLILESSSKYDYLIVSGGDGTLKFVVTTLMKLEKSKRPILGYIPTGTVNDAGKAFGCGQRVSSGLRNLRRLETTNIDVVRVNNEYINFVIANGAFSDIAYSTRRGGKKMFGRLAYYIDAIPNLFKKVRAKVHMDIDGKSYDFVTPVVALMNSRNVGGFPVNFNYSIKDGLIDIYITKPGLLNGFFHFLFFKIKTLHLRGKKIHISTDLNTPWCYDGEKGEVGDVDIEVLKEELCVIGRAK